MTITGVDAKHIGKVLRMQPGDKLQIVSDDGVSALAEVASITESTVTATRDDIVNAAKSFVGEYMQIPPMYSALKVNGQKLYQLQKLLDNERIWRCRRILRRQV